jgi:hypothetical protein
VAGSGVQQARPVPGTLLAEATEGNPWAALACLLTGPGCLAADLWARSGELREASGEYAAGVAQGLSDGAGSLVGDVAAGAADLITATTEPLDRAASLAMWTAIALYAVLGIILAIVVWWVFK